MYRHNHGNLLAIAATTMSLLVVSPAIAAHGTCGFDVDQLKFAGDDLTQARCLLRFVKMYAHLDADPVTLPAGLEGLIGRSTEDVADKVRAFFADEANVPGGNDLTTGLSHARNDDSNAPQARYFVIHDTSSPYLGDVAAFPGDINTSTSVNRLSGYGGSNSKAHLFINRKGEWLTGHDFGTPWRATKLELNVVGNPAKGLFLHIELIQPRRRDPNGGASNDALSPVPGFTPAQYEALALAYIAASVRGGKWLIPAFHAALDEGLNDGHDDPQNFDLGAFSAAVKAQLDEISGD